MYDPYSVEFKNCSEFSISDQNFVPEWPEITHSSAPKLILIFPYIFQNFKSKYHAHCKYCRMGSNLSTITNGRWYSPRDAFAPDRHQFNPFNGRADATNRHQFNPYNGRAGFGPPDRADRIGDRTGN